jgi:hypothetical protein
VGTIVAVAAQAPGADLLVASFAAMTIPAVLLLAIAIYRYWARFG